MKSNKNLSYWLALFLLLISVSFTFSSTEGVEWLWQDRVEVPIILVSAAVGTVIWKVFLNQSQTF